MNLDVAVLKTLFISTYEELITIGLLKDYQLIAKKENVSERSHSTYLLPMIEAILKECGLKTSDLNEVLVINGPGSFTGVRLGVTVAKTLAYTLKIPIKTISSLEALALSDPLSSEKIVTLNDAKGTYIGIFVNETLKGKIKYLASARAQIFLKKYANIKQVGNVKLNLEAIAKALKNQTPLNPHAINPLYIKKIEVQND